VIVGSALRVGCTFKQLANRGASQDAQGVRSADLVLATLLVSRAGRNRGYLTLGGEWVPYVGRRTLTDGPVVLHAANFVLATTHDSTRIYTAPFSANVDAANTAGRTVLLSLATVFLRTTGCEVLGVPRESIDTNTGTMMVISDTSGIRPTLDISTGIHALVQSLY